MLKIKQYLCRHDYTYIAKHKSTQQNLWKCKKCQVYYIYHWGMNVGYKCKQPNIHGWMEFKNN